MSLNVRRLVRSGALSVAVLAVPVAALASGAGHDGHQPTPSGGTITAGPSSVAAPPPALVSVGGLSDSRLQAGLAAAKHAGGTGPAAVAAFCASTGLSHAAASEDHRHRLRVQHDRSLMGPVAANLLASRLNIDTAAAQRVFQQLGALSGKTGVDPANAAFAEIARSIGVAPAQLAAALDAVKRASASQ